MRGRILPKVLGISLRDCSEAEWSGSERSLAERSGAECWRGIRQVVGGISGRDFSEAERSEAEGALG